VNSPLHRLVYYSRNRVPGGPEAVARAVAEILAASRANNARVGVTGALLFNTGCFAQVLEGPISAVEATFERIQQDARHDDVSLLAFDPAPTRLFDTWSMAFVGADSRDNLRYGAIARDSGYDPARMNLDHLFQTLERLAREEERQAA